MFLENTLLAPEESQLFFEKNPQPMWVIDFDTLSFLAVNEAALEFYGYSKNEFLSMTIKDIRPAEDVHALLEEISRGERPTSQSAWRHKKKDGSIIDVEVLYNFIEFGGRDARLVLITDVTERLKQEKELRAAHERFHAFMNNSTAMSFMKDEEGRYVYVSQPIERFYGKKSSALIGKNAFDLWPEDVAVRLRENDRSVLDSGRVQEFEEVLTDADGNTRSCLSFKFPLKDSEGQTLLGSVAIDITERKRAEQRLQESELRFRRLAENIREVFWIKDTNKPEVVYVSPIYEEVWGRTCESLYERAVSRIDAVHLDDREYVMAAFERSTQGQETDDEYRIVRPDGAIRWIHDRAFPIKDETGKAIRVVGIAEDITERKQSEEALEKSEARFRATFEHAGIGIALATLDGKLVETNRILEDFLGYSAEELLSRSYVDLTHPDDLAAEEELFKGLMAGEGEYYRMEKRYVRKGGQSVWGNLTVSLMRDRDGQPQFAIAMVENIHERKLAEEALRKSEEQLRQAQKMESVGRLAGGVAHDFNNLLTAITGYSDLGLRKLNQNDPLRKNLEEIRKAADRASGLTRQLLAFSRKQVMEKRVLNLNAILSDMNKMLPRLIGEDIKIDLSLDKELGKIKADPGQIEQVIVNLVVNARDAMPDGGTLTIKTSNVIMDEKLVRTYASVQSGAHVLLSISDTGFGMDEETQQRIFEPFFTTKEVGKGTGLGLSTVFGIVKQSGGSIWVESKVGKGATFKVYLPVVDGQADTLEALTAVKDVARGTETILLVEDDDLVRGIARTTLDMCGYKVLEASNAGEALLISKERNCAIDLMLTDVVMPRMNGQTLVKEINKVCPHLKVLYMSGYTDDVVAPRGVSQEKADFIHKPFTPEALATRVRKALDSAP